MLESIGVTPLTLVMPSWPIQTIFCHHPARDSYQGTVFMTLGEHSIRGKDFLASWLKFGVLMEDMGNNLFRSYISLSISRSLSLSMIVYRQ